MHRIEIREKLCTSYDNTQYRYWYWKQTPLCFLWLEWWKKLKWPTHFVRSSPTPSSRSPIALIHSISSQPSPSLNGWHATKKSTWAQKVNWKSIMKCGLGGWVGWTEIGRNYEIVNWNKINLRMKLETITFTKSKSFSFVVFHLNWICGRLNDLCM